MKIARKTAIQVVFLLSYHVIMACARAFAQSAYDTSTILHQTVVVDGLSADVSVYRAAQTGAHIVRVAFYSSDTGALRVAELRNLYPGLPNGPYTLQIFFSPRGGSQKVALRPISFIVRDKEPL
jgi:hypothetical protein